MLHVCMGNICRSPMAERILRAELDDQFGAEGSGVRTHGAGTYAGHEGHPMNPPAAAALARRGVDASRFTARGLTRLMVHESDLVLTATRDQVRRVVAIAPDAASRTFTLLELAALTAYVDVSRGGDLAERVHRLTAAADEARCGGAALPTDLDIDDPYGLPDAAFDATADEITRAIGRIVTALG